MDSSPCGCYPRSARAATSLGAGGGSTVRRSNLRGYLLQLIVVHGARRHPVGEKEHPLAELELLDVVHHGHHPDDERIDHVRRPTRRLRRHVVERTESLVTHRGHRVKLTNVLVLVLAHLGGHVVFRLLSAVQSQPDDILRMEEELGVTHHAHGFDGIAQMRPHAVRDVDNNVEGFLGLCRQAHRAVGPNFEGRARRHTSRQL